MIEWHAHKKKYYIIQKQFANINDESPNQIFDMRMHDATSDNYR